MAKEYWLFAKTESNPSPQCGLRAYVVNVNNHEGVFVFSISEDMVCEINRVVNRIQKENHAYFISRSTNTSVERLESVFLNASGQLCIIREDQEVLVLNALPFIKDSI